MCCGTLTTISTIFTFSPCLALSRTTLVIDDAIEVGFELAAQFNDVLIGFFGDLAAVARADSGLQFLLLSVCLEPSGRGIGTHLIEGYNSELEGQNLRPARSSWKAPELGADSGFCVLAQWDGGAL